MESPKTAVVAIHGVADQSAGATAQQCADLLLEAEGSPYTAVERTPLSLAVSPHLPNGWSRVMAKAASDSPAPEGSALTYQSPTVKRWVKKLAPTQLVGDEADSDGESDSSVPDSEQFYALSFHDRLWSAAEGEVNEGEIEESFPQKDRRYETARHRLTSPENPGRRQTVDVFELHWADLSRLGDSVFGAFLGVYQLLFFLPILGQSTLGYARLEALLRPGGRRRLRAHWWATVDWLYAVIVKLMTLAVPILNLGLLSLVAFAVVPMVASSNTWNLGITAAVLGLGLALVLSLAMGLLPASRRMAWLSQSKSFLLAFVMVLGAAGILAYFRLDELERGSLVLLALGLWGLFAVACLALLWIYAKRCPSAFSLGLAAFGVLFVYLVLQLPWAVKESETLLHEVAEAAKPLASLHWYVWIPITVMTLLWSVLFCGGAIVTRSSRTRAALITALVALVLPGAALLLINLALWSGLVLAADQLELPALEPALRVAQDLVDRAIYPSHAQPWDSAASYLQTIRWGSIVGAAGLVFALLGLVWSVVPAVLADFQWFQRLLGRRSSAFDEWLAESTNSLFRWARWVVVGLIVLFGVLYPLYSALGETADRETFRLLPVILPGLGGALLAAIIGRGPLRFLAVGFRAVLDVSLDVMNWQRTRPAGGTACLRITSRFLALLAHLKHEGYQRIVLVAHSQGTVIAADVLRHLAHTQTLGDAMSKRELHVVTFGSPLRQVYGRRFPLTYGWTYDDERNWNLTTANNIDHVTEWRNLYGSGDYVGRALWHHEEAADASKYSDQVWDATGPGTTRRIELCIGARGHTSYWHDPTVARVVLDVI